MSGPSGAPARSTPPARRSALALWALAGVVVLALVVGAVAGALREPVELDPSTPQGVVQAYVRAVLDGDFAAAHDLLSGETAERCGPATLEDTYVAEGLTVTLVDVSIGGDEAEVRVRLREPAAPPLLGGGGTSMQERFALVREAGRWRLTGQPWPLYWCPEEAR